MIEENEQHETPVFVTDEDLGVSLHKGDSIECPNNCGSEHQIVLAKNSEGVETDMMMFVQCGEQSFCVGIAGRRWK